jgi:hypothetical protein
MKFQVLKCKTPYTLRASARHFPQRGEPPHGGSLPLREKIIPHLCNAQNSLISPTHNSARAESPATANVAQHSTYYQENE